MSSRKERKRAKRAAGALPFGPAKVVVEQEGVEKMSEILAEFAKPLLEGVESKKTARTLYFVASTARNLALLPDDVLAEQLCDVVDQLEPHGDTRARLTATDALVTLVERKRELWPDNRRFIVGLDVVTTPTGFNLTVRSTMEAPESVEPPA